MSDLLLDYSTWDLTVEDGDLVFITSREFLARQAVVMTLRAFRGEWFRNIEYGTPWITNDNNDISILGKTPKAVFDSYVKGSILSNEEILSIISYSSTIDPATGVITVEGRLGIEGGEIDFSEEIL